MSAGSPLASYFLLSQTPRIPWLLLAPPGSPWLPKPFGKLGIQSGSQWGQSSKGTLAWGHSSLALTGSPKDSPHTASRSKNGPSSPLKLSCGNCSSVGVHGSSPPMRSQEESRRSQEEPGGAPQPPLIKKSLMRPTHLFPLIPKPMRNCHLAESHLMSCTGWDPQLGAKGAREARIAQNIPKLAQPGPPLAPSTVGPILAQFLITEQQRNCHLGGNHCYNEKTLS